MRLFVFSCFALLFGMSVGYYFLFHSPQTLVHLKNRLFPASLPTKQKQIIGFLPYWLVEKAQLDYSGYLTTLTYFGLSIGMDGKIQYLVNEQEEEPGYHKLKSKKLRDMLAIAKKNDLRLSLLVFSGDTDLIDALLADPITHAKNLVDDAQPLMKKYGFTDLNLDIESTRLATDEERSNFTAFVREVKKHVRAKKLGTVTVEISGQDLIKKTRIDPRSVAQIADYVVVMAYDFHYQGSFVSGPVAPLGGGESEAEFDTKIVLQQAEKFIPREKIILGVPSYGYSWETLYSTPRSATLPGSGITVSHSNAEKFIKDCGTCSAKMDTKAQEAYVIYKDKETGTYHQIFFPDKNAMEQKIAIAKKKNLGGLAVWALGYEGEGLYAPLGQYKKDTFDITRL